MGLEKLFQTEAKNPLRVIYDDGDYLFPDQGWEAGDAHRLDQLLEGGAFDGLEVHYHGHRALYMFPSGSVSFSRYLTDRLPPGRDLSAYLLATSGRCFALLPRAVADPFFEAASRHGLLTCHLKALPSLGDGEHVVRTRGAQWLILSEDGQPKRLMPVPTGEEDAEARSETDLFEPALFQWVDPQEQKRLDARKNRSVLVVASVVCTVLLLLVGLGLFGANRYYEGRLAALSVAQQKVKAQRKHYKTLRAELDQTLEQLQVLRGQSKGLTPQAVRIRHIFNQVESKLMMTRFAVEAGLEGRLIYTLEGTAPDPTEVDGLVRRLEKTIDGVQPVLTRLEREQWDRHQRRKAGNSEPPYQFTIVMEVDS